jgi:hypothetical protein
MPWIRLQMTPIATVCTIVYIIGGTFAPTIVFACEGGGPEANISIKPVESSRGGGGCHQNLLKTEVIFENINEWCEYEIKNENTTEKLLLAQKQTYVKNGKCEFAGGALCLDLVAVAAGKTRCGTGTILPVGVGKECYDRLQYEKKPAGGGEEKLALVVEAESVNANGVPTGAKKTLTETQKVK